MNRVIPGLALALCWFLILLKGSSVLFALVLIAGLSIGAYEYAKMAFSFETVSSSVSFASLCLLPLLSVFLTPQLGISGGLVLAFLLLAFWTLATYGKEPDSYLFFSKSVFGLLWVGFLGAHLLLIRNQPDGNFWILILTGITAGSDSGAYYAGRTFGKNKLSPLISPNKTIEGAAGGIITGMAVAAFLAFLLLDTVPWPFLFTSALLLGVVGICGDLVESIVKRATDTKDSGTILGGHGGILDRADSIILAAPVLYYLLVISS